MYVLLRSTMFESVVFTGCSPAYCVGLTSALRNIFLLSLCLCFSRSCRRKHKFHAVYSTFSVSFICVVVWHHIFVLIFFCFSSVSLQAFSSLILWFCTHSLLSLLLALKIKFHFCMLPSLSGSHFLLSPLSSWIVSFVVIFAFLIRSFPLFTHPRTTRPNMPLVIVFICFRTVCVKPVLIFVAMSGVALTHGTTHRGFVSDCMCFLSSPRCLHVAALYPFYSLLCFCFVSHSSFFMTVPHLGVPLRLRFWVLTWYTAVVSATLCLWVRAPIQFLFDSTHWVPCSIAI